MCQYAHVIDHLQMKNADIFTLRFANNATWISITNTVLVYSHEWNTLIEEHFLSEHDRVFDSMDAMIFGKFTLYDEALNTNFEHTMKDEQEYYEQKQQQDTNTTRISFSSIPPPQLVDAARLYSNHPIIAISMFAANDVARATASRDQFRHAFPNRTNVQFVDGRQHIDMLGLECGSDDKLTVGSCHEPGDIVRNSNRNPADMHRCAGPLGGHADLIAWDIIERLHELLL
jgi:hypothetical protein